MTDASVTLTQLMYAEPLAGSLMSLYVYHGDGTHDRIRFTSSEIHKEDTGKVVTATMAAAIEMKARYDGLETRVTDSGDMLLLHSKNGVILYPKDTTGGAFWSRV